MKFFISVDMEGITGAQHWDQVSVGKPGYDLLRERMNRDTSLLASALLKKGAREVMVRDAHDTARNLDPEGLPRGCRLIRGWAPEPLCMIAGIEEDTAGLLMLGYHSSAGEGGSPLAHSMSTQLVDARLNGKPASEMRLHGLAASEMGIPLLFVAGDAGICEEAAEWIPGISTVVTQRAFGHRVELKHPQEVREEIAAAVAALDLAHLPAPAPREAHYQLDLRFRETAQATRAGFFPGATQLDAYRVRLESESVREVLASLLFVL